MPNPASYTGPVKTRKRRRKTKRKTLSDTKPMDIPTGMAVVHDCFPTYTTPEDVTMFTDEPHDLGPLPTADEIGPPPPLIRSKACTEHEEFKKDTSTPEDPPPTPLTPSTPHNKKNCRKMFVPLSKGEMADLMNPEGYYIVTPHDLKNTLKFRRVVKTARMYPSVYLTDNNFKLIDTKGVKTAVRLNGRNASRLPGSAQHRALATIAVCSACELPLSINMLKDFGFGAKSAKDALRQFESHKAAASLVKQCKENVKARDEEKKEVA